jgi:hypothetical protein
MTLEEIERQFPEVSKNTREAYDRLNGRANRGGLYAQLRGAKETLKKKGLLKGVKEKTESEILGLEAEIREAEAEYNKFQTQKNLLTREFNKLKKAEEEGKLKEATAKGAGNVYQKAIDGLKEAELSLQGYKGEEKYQTAYRKAQAAYETAVSSGLKPKPLGTPRIPVPPVEDKTSKGNAGEEGKVDDNLSAFISTLADPANSNLLKEVQRDFAKNFGYKGPIDGLYSLPFQDAIDSIATKRSSLPQSLQGENLRAFIADDKSAQLLGATAGGLGGGVADPDDYVTIASPSVAKGVINQVFQAELQRDATAEELKKLTPGLIAAQKKNPNRVKIVNGVRQTTQGLDAGQWITDRLQKLPEYAQRKKDKTIPDIQILQDTARNNGLTLLPSQIESYRTRLQNGEKVETIQSNIRAIAANAMPDNVKKLLDAGSDLTEVYQPYRQSMATILEIPMDKIDLNDPTLTNAITDKGNMTLFDFKKSLRKDPRWQYTDNARETVSSGLTQVLKDFGFMG